MNPVAKTKIYNALLIVTSLFGYLKWGTDNRVFLVEAEVQIILKLFNHLEAVLHPFTVLPMIGQIFLLVTLFQKKPNRILTYTGLAGIGILLVLMFAIGLISFNIKILLSTFPFMIVAIITIRHTFKNR